MGYNKLSILELVKQNKDIELPYEITFTSRYIDKLKESLEFVESFSGLSSLKIEIKNRDKYSYSLQIYGNLIDTLLFIIYVKRHFEIYFKYQSIKADHTLIKLYLNTGFVYYPISHFKNDMSLLLQFISEHNFGVSDDIILEKLNRLEHSHRNEILLDGFKQIYNLNYDEVEFSDFAKKLGYENINDKIVNSIKNTLRQVKI